MLKPSLHQVVYQIWPRSFHDANGDGIGDIQGIIQKLPYLKALGIQVIWLSPIYPSPNHDYGYDISDYRSIHPDFGTMADFEALMTVTKEMNISIVMDLVANHTSDQHPWYQAALKDPKSPYREYYFFKEGQNNQEPNNWISLFGGSAWTQVEENLYSLNLFTPQQKDLNWENPKVRSEFQAICEFWLEKGVAGFRLDVINMISKTRGLPDSNPHKKGYQFAKEYFVSLPLSHVYIQELYEAVLKKYPGFFVGEGLLINPEMASQYCGNQSHELDLMFHFDLALVGCGPLGKYDFRKLYHYTTLDFKKVFFKWQNASVQNHFMLGNFLSNHDQPRAVSRYGNTKKYHAESAKLLQTLTFTSKGTPFLYQGEEIGMTNLKLEEKDWKDFEAINDYQVLQKMMHLPAFLMKKVIQKMTRDQARTPMQWTNKEHAGFSSNEPWMVLNPNYQSINVEQQLQDPYSVLSYTKELISLYQAHDLFAFGGFEALLVKHPQIIAYRRFNEHHHFIVLLNLSAKVASFKCDEAWLEAKMVVSNRIHPGPLESKMVFAPYEARILQVK